ncbi:MAG: HD domain-containing protein [Dehalococcoidia bacterium]|nr:HD domain-containing protein [Dehalococcoidia bacterium]
MRCSGCGGYYLEVEESGFSHPDGPDYYTRGPLHLKLGELALERIAVCPAPFDNHQIFCECLGHRFMANILYQPWQRPEAQTDPWVEEEELISRLGQFLTPAAERALTLAKRVHGDQPRDDGMSYLCEHVFPITVEVVDYVKDKLPPLEVDRAAIVALLHDSLEDREWAGPPLTDDEIGAAVDPEILATVRVLTKLPKTSAKTGQRDYMARLRQASFSCRTVKVFDRLNNLRCLHKNWGKAGKYLDETSRDYVPFAEELDPALGRQMADLVEDLKRRLALELESSNQVPEHDSAHAAASEAPTPEELDKTTRDLKEILEAAGIDAKVASHHHKMDWARRKMGL